MKNLLPLIFGCVSCISFGQNLSITEAGRFTDGRDAACEISAYDPYSARVFITNSAVDSIEIVDFTNLSAPVRLQQVDVLSYGGGVNSLVNLNNGYFAAAIENGNKQENGYVVFFDINGNYAGQVEVGALPDMITITPDKSKLIVANEGEPNDDYTIDPKGSVSIIDISMGIPYLTQNDVVTLTFEDAPSSIPGSVRKPNTPIENDLEPEYIAISPDGTTALVSCQESNVFIRIDLTTNTILDYKGLGFKDHSLTGNGFDASNQDNGINITTWPVKGVYQPDAISSYMSNNQLYWVSANEGDGRDYAGYSSETRVKDLILDPTVFPNAATLQSNDQLGRLKTFTPDVIGDIDNDGDVDEIYAYGGRSFSIWDATGNLVWDSGDQIEQFISSTYPAYFNCDDGVATELDSRSDDKGPEPEAITIGKIGYRTFAFIGLERQGGILVYNITDPSTPIFETFIETYDGNGGMTDIGPEGILFVSAEESHSGENLLIVSNEVSGTTTIYEIEDLTASITEPNSLTSLRLFPNPSDSKIKVELKNESTGNYSIIDNQGRVVLTGEFVGYEFELDVTFMRSGFYNLIIQEDTGVILTTSFIRK